MRSKYELSKLLEIGLGETTEKGRVMLDLTACTPRAYRPSAELRQSMGPDGNCTLAEGMWILYISGRGCAELSKGQAGLQDLNLTF